MEVKAIYLTDRYNYACNLALCGNTDEALIELTRMSTEGIYSNYQQITEDEDFKSLRNDRRWIELIKKIKNNKREKEKKYNKKLIKELSQIYKDDQDYRLLADSIEEKLGYESKESHEIWGKINVNDSVNLLKVKKILDEKGWLGKDIIGENGNTNLFLVIQHSNLETQKKYIPMLRDAVEKGDADANDLALMEDRIALGEGRKQIYGSQISYDDKTGESYVSPLEDPINVNKRRARVGLEPVEIYVSQFNIKWNVDEYVKKLPII